MYIFKSGELLNDSKSYAKHNEVAIRKILNKSNINFKQSQR